MHLRPTTAPKNIVERVAERVVREMRNVSRRRIAKSIVRLPASPAATVALPFSIHMLTCRRDLHMAICAAKAMNLVCEAALPWIFHDDGTLGTGDLRLLAEQFPGCAVLESGEADARMNKLLSDQPNLKQLRDRSPLMKKLLDVPVFANRARFIYIDSDLLFFRRPSELLERASQKVGGNLFNRDLANAYCFNPELVLRTCEIEIPQRINSGCYICDTDYCNVANLERWLGSLVAAEPNFYIHYAEQTLTAMAAGSSAGGAHHLSEPYDVAYGKDVTSSICKHYVGHIRHGFELEGLTYLLNECDFARRWSEFCSGEKRVV
ncbi:MAG TPA: hypothetical protein VH518_04445 [Tepidisphaeraceae bacterium]|jgi:hypothetical protein